MARTSKRRSRRIAGTIPQLGWRSVVNGYPPAEPLSADQVESIHEASLAILERMGIRVLHREARELFAGAGARTTVQRANAIWKQLLHEYQQPKLDAGIDEALADYVSRRKREINACNRELSAKRV